MKEYAEEIKKLKEALDKRKAGQVGGGDSKKKEKKNQYFILLFIKNRDVPSHSLELGIVDIEDLNKAKRLRVLEEQQGEFQSKNKDVQNELKEKELLIQQEKEQQEK